MLVRFGCAFVGGRVLRVSDADHVLGLSLGRLGCLGLGVSVGKKEGKGREATSLN